MLKGFNFQIKILFLLFAFALLPFCAKASVYRDGNISTMEGISTLIGDISSSQFGSAIETLDINGDKHLDLVVSAPVSSTNDLEWNGRIYVFFGDGSSEIEDMSLASDTADIVIEGQNEGDQLGTDFAMGDYNNDGFDDLAIGAYNAMEDGDRPGKVYVMYGRKNWGSHSSDYDLDKAQEEYTGGLPGDGFGLSVDTADLDGDEVDDLLVGAPFASSEEVSDSGMVYGYLGTARGLSNIANYTFRGEQENQRFGAEVKSADIDGDQREDIIIGAYYTNIGLMNRAGAVYVFSGYNPESLETLNKISDYTYRLTNGVTNSWFGFSIDTGDVNGDMVNDIAVSSFPYKGVKERADVQVYYGSNVFDTGADMTINGASEDIIMGASVALGDLNYDSKADVVVGAPNINLTDSEVNGETYIVYGGIEGTYSAHKRTVHSLIRSEAANDWFGSSLHVADLNNDNFNDLIVGARYGDGVNSVNNGKVYVLYGKGVRFGEETEYFSDEENEDYINRGELIRTVLEEFNTREKRKDTIDSCYEHKEFCLFNFLAMSSYEGIQLDPELILYPDVGPDNEYYEDVNIGTILGFVNGHLGQESSPYRTEDNVTRIQALKVILAAANQVPNKYRFELIDELGSVVDLYSQKTYFEDVNPRIPYMWWYPRYVNFAVENDIVNDTDLFYPDNYITRDELFDMIDRTLASINLPKNAITVTEEGAEENSKALVSGDTEDEAVGETGQEG